VTNTRPFVKGNPTTLGMEETEKTSSQEQKISSQEQSTLNQEANEEGNFEEPGELNDPVNPNIVAWGLTLYNYEATNDTELSFRQGEYVGIIEEGEDGWCTGELNGAEGLFPSNYIQKLDEQPKPSEDKKEDDEGATKRREKRAKMKEEMRLLKDEVDTQIKKRQELEKEIQQLTQTKQRVATEFKSSKATISDKTSLFFDVLKLGFSIDDYFESLSELQQKSTTSLEALSSFVSDLAKEAKNSSALAPLSTRITASFKDLKNSS